MKQSRVENNEMGVGQGGLRFQLGKAYWKMNVWKHTYTHSHTYKDIHIQTKTYTYKQTNIHTYIYIYICNMIAW